MSSAPGPLEALLAEALFAQAPVGVVLWDAEGRFVRTNDALRDSHGTGEELVGHRPAEMPGSVGGRLQALVDEVLRSGEPVVDLELGDHAVARLGESRQWRTELFPLRNPVSGAGLIGVAGILIDISAEHAAQRRERAARREVEEARARALRAQGRAEALVAAGMALSTAVGPQEVLRALVAAAVPQLADMCAIHTSDARGSLHLGALAHREPARQARMGADPAVRTFGPDALADVLRSGMPLILAEVGEAAMEAAGIAAEHRAVLTELEVGSLAVLPLRARDRSLGMLSLLCTGSGRRYEGELLQTVQALAQQAALALDNAALYAEQAEVARVLQRDLMPAALPDVPGVELDARYRPAGRVNHAGGDFYDVWHDERGFWHFVIGDVVGKGAQAAARTAHVRAALRAAASQDEPAQVVGAANTALAGRLGDEGAFCTALYGRMRVQEDGGLALQLVSAGHPPALVRRSDGAVQELPTGGIALGIEPQAGYRAVECRLVHGELLLMYTDGATELRGDGPADRGDRELRRLLAEARDVGAYELVARVEAHVLQAAGDTRDDLAVVALRPMPR